MNTIDRTASQVKPSRPARTFGEGILPADKPACRGRFVPTAADLAWAAATSPTRNEFYDVLIERPRPICGGAPEADEPTDAEWDAMAELAAAADRLERGLVA